MNEERPGGPIRIGDREREDAVKRLAEHYEAGRLTTEEHSARVDQALNAKTDADLAALFTDLPGEQTTGPDSEAWAGPWGWSKPPWTAPQNSAGNSGPGSASGGFGPRGFVGRMPFPLLIMLGVFGVLASIGCVLGGGHPPILPILLIVAAVYVIRKRRMERRA
ncbi:MAG: DUF1707 domain-containing protein [Kribbellaceae bacterium]|nr:DUF1707 domain-containing protein [Kribbellaceae bacterium]